MLLTVTMHNVLQFLFMALIALPLPILLLYHPFLHIQDRIMQRRYYKVVKKHFDNPSTVSAEQLSDIFPDKKMPELRHIAYQLQEDNDYKDS